jgi:hypothetical protein
MDGDTSYESRRAVMISAMIALLELAVECYWFAPKMVGHALALSTLELPCDWGSVGVRRINSGWMIERL